MRMLDSMRSGIAGTAEVLYPVNTFGAPDWLKAEVVQMLARIRVRSEEEVAEMEAEQQRIAARLQRQMLASGGGAPAESAYGGAAREDSAGAGGDVAATVQRPMHLSGPKIGRNDPCPCGSGKKYKHCHGQLN